MGYYLSKFQKVALMNKNIWIINQYTGSPYHGMNYRSYYLAKEFIKSGYQVTIFTGSYSHLFQNLPKTQGVFTKEKIDGINYVWVKTPQYKKSKSIGRVFNMIVFMFFLFFVNIFKMEKPDKIIISSLSLFPVINAYVWSKLLKRKFIFEIRDMWPQTLIELGGVSPLNPLVLFMKGFEWFGYKKAEYVVSLLPNTRDYMIVNGMNKNKFYYIPNGVVEDKKSNGFHIEYLENKIPSDKFIVGYAGTIGIANALEYLINVAILLKDNHKIFFVLTGAGGDKEKLLDKCKDNNLNNVLFLNAIPKQQINKLLNLYDVCYIGWHKNALYRFGISANKIFEYMLNHKPIIHSYSGSHDPIKEANCGWTVESENIESLKETIVKISELPKNELEKIGDNGYNYVLKYHEYTKLSDQYKELLK